EAAQRRLEDLAVQRRVLEREAAVGANHDERLASIQQQRLQTEAELTSLNGRWELEKTLVQRIREIREQLEQQVARKRRASAAIAAVKVDGAGVDASAVQEAATTEAQAMASADELRAELATLNQQLEALQGDSPLMRVCVDASLVDEVEKAHPDVLELFFQVFDKGRMEDGEGRQIDFKNCVIILTTNAGTDTIMKLTADPETVPSHEGLIKALKPELDKTFKPAFLG